MDIPESLNKIIQPLPSDENDIQRTLRRYTFQLRVSGPDFAGVITENFIHQYGPVEMVLDIVQNQQLSLKKIPSEDKDMELSGNVTWESFDSEQHRDIHYDIRSYFLSNMDYESKKHTYIDVIKGEDLLEFFAEPQSA